MELTEIYGICIGGVIALLILTSLSFSLGIIVHRHARQHFLRLLYYPSLPSWLSGHATISRFEASVFLLILVTNICCVTVNVSDIAEINTRLGHAALINLIPVCAGAHMNVIISLCNVSLENYAQAHRWLGAMVTLEALIHTLMSCLSHQTNVHEATDVAGIVASCAVGAITLVALPVFRRWMFEVFSWLHSVLAVVAVMALWWHLGTTEILRPPRIYLLLASSTFVSVKLLRILGIMYLNISTNGTSIAAIQQTGAGMEVRVSLARQFEHRAGQFVYLNIPRLALFQSHPFQIAWTYQDEAGHLVIVLLIQPRHGFTGRLALADSLHGYHAFVEGPYGRSIGIGQYGTVLLFATGIGIAAQLAYVKELLELYHDCRVKTRRIALFWELDAEVHRFWVRSWMDELLALDVDYILDMELFIRGNFLSKQASKGTVSKLGQHERITLHYAPMDPDILIASEIEKRKGRTLVSLCTKPETTQAITKVVQSMLDQDIHTRELEFRPSAAAFVMKKAHA